MRNSGGLGLFGVAMLAVAVAVSGWCAMAPGETWWVNNETGRDSFDGRSAEPQGDGVHGPLATFKRAASVLRISDRLEIAKTSRPYREILTISKGGVPDAPLVVDGHGATIDALDVVPAAEWKSEPDGLFSTRFATNANKLERVKDVMTWIGAPQIWFVDGRPAPNAKSRQELAAMASGFYWNKGEHRLYFKPPAEKQLEDLHVEIPRRGTGIVVFGVDHVVVQNLRSIHSLNDGVGTGHCTGVVFRNIDGSDNCDQGFSAHSGAVNIIEDCRLERNAGSGICDVNNSVTIFRRCVIAHNTFESGDFFLDDGFHVLDDCAIFDNDDGPQVIAGGQCSVQLHNCVVCGKPGNAQSLVDAEGGNLTLDTCTVADGVVGARLGQQAGRPANYQQPLFTMHASVGRRPQGRRDPVYFELQRLASGRRQFRRRPLHGADMARLSPGQRAGCRLAHSRSSLRRRLAAGRRQLRATVFAAFSLPAKSLYLHAGEKGHRVGAASRTAPGW